MTTLTGAIPVANTTERQNNHDESACELLAYGGLPLVYGALWADLAALRRLHSAPRARVQR